MKCQQTITTPFANRPFQPKPTAAVKKCNLVPLTRSNRAKYSLPRRINVKKHPEATELNWASTIQQEFIPGSQGCSTKHVNQPGPHTRNPANGPSIPMFPPTSPAAPAKVTEHSTYCAICTPLCKICLEEFAVSSDWDEDKDDQAKDKDKRQWSEPVPNQPQFLYSNDYSSEATPTLNY